ncbi:MAG TPA: DUF302 domain-containing protein [Candidatus Cybelea sp.]
MGATIPDDVKAALDAYRDDRTSARWTELSQLWVGELQVVDALQRLHPEFPDALPLPVDGVIEDNAELYQWQTLPDPAEVLRALETLPGGGTNVVTTVSRFAYADTLGRLKDAIAKGGGTIFAAIDQSAAAESVGLTLRPTTLILFGNPQGGTPLMEAFPMVALDLPLKLLVWEEDGQVNVAYAPMSEIAVRYGVTGMDARIEAMGRVLNSLTNAIS